MSLSIGLPIDIYRLFMRFKCPYCRRDFESPEKQRCPHCHRVVLTPGFFKARPRQSQPPDAPAPTTSRRSAKPPVALALFGHSGFKVAAVLLLLMLAGSALVGKAKSPPVNSNARKIDRARLSLANVRVALEIFKDDTGAYPAAQEGLAALVHPPTTTNGWRGPYVYELKNDLWGTPFQYELTSTNVALFCCGPDRLPGTPDDIVIQQADIRLEQSQGTVYGVIVFRDGTRKIIREQVTAEKAIPTTLAPDAPSTR
jgi:general secretion pathway protein G